MAIASIRGDTGPPPGSCRSSSSSTSDTAFSATGFLLGFLILPISKRIPNRSRVGSFMRATKPGAGSTRIIAGGPSRGRSSTQRRARQSRNASWRSLSTMHVDVYELTVSRTTNMSYRLRLITSAANETPIASGASVVVCSMSVVGILLSDMHVWHASVTRSIAWSMFSAKKLRRTTSFSWCFDGWLSFRWIAVSKPSNT